MNNKNKKDIKIIFSICFSIIIFVFYLLIIITNFSSFFALWYNEKMNFTKVLLGENINLKLIEPSLENAQMIFELLSKNRDHLRPWFPWADNTLLQTIDFLLHKKEIMYGIFSKKDNKYIGNISMIKLDLEKKKSGEIGYWIGSEFAGKGIMSEAVKILEKEFFENFDLERIVIRCNAKNKPSARVAEKNNYFFEGTSRKDRYNDFSGQLEDSLNFSKLKEEYFLLKKK